MQTAAIYFGNSPRERRWKYKTPKLTVNLHEDLTADITSALAIDHFKKVRSRSFDYLKQSCDIKPNATNCTYLREICAGHGIPKNTTKALASFSLAKALGDDDADEDIKTISKQVSKEQLQNRRTSIRNLGELKEKLMTNNFNFFELAIHSISY